MTSDAFMVVALLLTVLVLAYFLWRYTQQRDRVRDLGGGVPTPVSMDRVSSTLRAGE